MLPLSLLNSTVGNPIMVELKSGESYNGSLVNCDTWMNMNLRDVICTSPDGARFWKMAECYIRGNMIKYLRVPDEILLTAKEDNRKFRQGQQQRGARGGRGRGGHYNGQGSGRGGTRGSNRSAGRSGARGDSRD